MAALAASLVVKQLNHDESWCGHSTRAALPVGPRSSQEGGGESSQIPLQDDVSKAQIAKNSAEISRDIWFRPPDAYLVNLQTHRRKTLKIRSGLLQINSGVPTSTASEKQWIKLLRRSYKVHIVKSDPWIPSGSQRGWTPNSQRQV